MKTIFKLFAIAAAFGLAPATAFGQAAAPAAPAAEKAAPPSDSISAASQAAPAQPRDVSDPTIANIGTEEPSDATVANATMASRTTPTPGIGQPDGRMGFQDQVTEIGERASWFHNIILMPIITIISVVVLALLLYVIVRFRRGAHPVPSRTTHNTFLEIMWTLVPVLILVAIAIPSIGLIRAKYATPKPDLTIKVTGNQWYWTYGYPDHGDFEIVSNMLSDKDAKARGEPRLLAVDERMVVPVNKNVKLIITAADVIHSWGIPAFWVKLDAVPGRLNETWFRAERPGIYYGQCFELCGARHAYMPIAVEVVSEEQFAAWIASKGGTMPGTARPESPDATVNSPVSNPAAAPATGGTEATPEPETTPGTATPPVSNQSAATSREGSN